MKDISDAAKEVALFCRLNINSKKGLPIRSSEMGLLIYLVKEMGEHTPLSAAHFFKVSKSMITNMVAALSQKGYLRKERSQIDKRSTILYPTEKAVQLVEETYDEYNKTISLLKNKMGAAHFESLIELLECANQILLEEKENG